MICHFCGREINEDLLFCPGCGKKVTQTPPKAEPESVYHDAVREIEPLEEEILYTDNDNYDIADEDEYIPDEYKIETYNGQEEDDSLYYDKTSVYLRKRQAKRKKSSSNTWIIVLAAVLAALVVVMAIFLFTTGTVLPDVQISDGEFIDHADGCAICKGSVKEGEKFCDKCKDSFTCEICRDVKKSTKNGYCEDCTEEYTCRNCDKVSDEVEDGYCKECSKKLRCKNPGCTEVVDDGYYCDSCIDRLISAENKGRCFVCEKSIDNDEVFLIDTYGSPYCLDCDTGKYCTECNGYLESGSTKNVCVFCAEFYCSDCGKVLDLDDVALASRHGKLVGILHVVAVLEGHVRIEASTATLATELHRPVGRVEERKAILLGGEGMEVVDATTLDVDVVAQLKVDGAVAVVALDDVGARDGEGGIGLGSGYAEVDGLSLTDAVAVLGHLLLHTRSVVDMLERAARGKAVLGILLSGVGIPMVTGRTANGVVAQ